MKQNFLVAFLLFFLFLNYSSAQSTEARYSLISYYSDDLVMVSAVLVGNKVEFSYLEYDGQRDVYHVIRSFQVIVRDKKLLELFSKTSSILKENEDSILNSEFNPGERYYEFTDHQNNFYLPVIQKSYITLLNALLEEIRTYKNKDFPYRI